MALWLKAEKYSVNQINVLPTAQPAIAAVVQVVAGMLSDSPLFNGKRWQLIVAMQVVTLFATIVLIIWNIPLGLKYTAFYLSYVCSGVPGLWYSWYPELIPDDHEMRGFVVASSNTFSFIMQVWWNLAIWRTVQGPRFTAGFTGATVAGVGIILLCFVLRGLEGRDRKRDGLGEGSGDVEGLGGDGGVDTVLKKGE